MLPAKAGPALQRRLRPRASPPWELVRPPAPSEDPIREDSGRRCRGASEEAALPGAARRRTTQAARVWGARYGRRSRRRGGRSCEEGGGLRAGSGEGCVAIRNGEKWCASSILCVRGLCLRELTRNRRRRRAGPGAPTQADRRLGYPGARGHRSGRRRTSARGHRSAR